MILITRETHDTPKSVQGELDRIFGFNPFGGPKYRAIWGWNSFYWIGGEFIEYDRSGNYLRTIGALRYVPRYLLLNPNRWYLEKWCPPSMYGTRESWEKEVETVNGVVYPQLGPFPSRGEYETSFCLEKNGRFVQITASIAREWAERVRASENFSDVERKIALQEQQKREEIAGDNVRKDIYADTSPFLPGSWTTVTRNFNKEKQTWVA